MSSVKSFKVHRVMLCVKGWLDVSLSSAVLGSQRWQSRAGTVGSVGPRQKSPGGRVLLSAGAAAGYVFVLFWPGLQSATRER